MTKPSFEDWMRRVDAVIAGRLCGLVSSDLPDCCYRDWFDAGVGPQEAARRAIANANDEDPDTLDEEESGSDVPEEDGDIGFGGY